MAVGDFDGNGALDLAVGNFPIFVSVLLGNGDGTFRAPTSYAVYSVYGLVAADLDANGTVDLVAGSANVSVHLGNGDGTFQPRRDYSAGFYVEVADFNGDGLLDLAVTTDRVRVLLGNGDGSFQTTQISYVAGSDPRAVAAGDFNSDGFPDLAVTNEQANTVTVLLNDGRWGRRRVPVFPTQVGGGNGPGRGDGDGSPLGNPQPPLATLLGNGAFLTANIGAATGTSAVLARIESSSAQGPARPVVDAFFAARVVEDRNDASVTWWPRTRIAVADGWSEVFGKDAGQLTKLGAFDPLRSRADFQELVRALDEKVRMK